jgi:hypothetical protein
MQLACTISKPLTVEQIDGNWVRKKYLDSLRSTRSQFSEQPENVSISAKNNRLNWTTYHESSWRRILRIEPSDNNYVLVVGQWEVESPASSETLYVPFKPTINHEGKIASIEFLDDSLVSSKREPFIRLPVPLKEYANELLLLGRYVDRNGKQYSFSKEGVASWPDKSFSYELPLDSSEAGCDYFQTDDPKEPGRWKRYGFKWKGDRLDLFTILYDRDTPIACEDHSFVSLVRR